MNKKLISCIGFVLMFVGCQDKEVARLAAELETSRGETATLRKALDETSAKLNTKDAALAQAESALEKVRAENSKLKQTAQFVFDVAVEKMNASTTDAGDEEAIKALQGVVDRFPNDPLARVAQGHIASVEDRMVERDEQRAKAREKVRGYVTICNQKATAAKQLRDSDAPKAAERAKPLADASKSAKDFALQLMERDRVPDPDGSLRREIQSCDAVE